MKVFKIIILLCNIIIFIPSFHFGFFALMPFCKRKKKNEIKNTANHKFLILIAARNEEIVLGSLIDSINKQKYNKDDYKICVLPNNCTDNTRDVAINKKCLVVDVDFKPKTKGEVLNYAFNYFKDDNSFDTYLIVDADNIMDPNFLKNINKKMNEGYKIVQGFRDTKNIYDNIISGGYAIFFYLQNLFLYESRSRLGESSTINGTGYAVSKDFIDKLNYNPKTVTEDIELTCICALNNEKIGYAEDAIFYDEQVTNFNISMKQRKRWIQGSMQVWKNNKRQIISKIKEKITFQLIDDFHMLTLPIVQSFAMFVLLFSYIFIVPLPIILISILIGYLGEVVVAFLLIIYYRKKISKLIASCLFFPIFHISWYPLYLYSIFKNNNNWEEIKHTKAINIEEFIEE